MYLDEILAAQKAGEARGVTSICSAHPFVLKQAIRAFEHSLIEATCNQVNQFGGYTGMTPEGFVRFVRETANENRVPLDHIILGGDHLGPSVWQEEPAGVAMEKAKTLIHDYVAAGFAKIHLDCSMPLADDPQGALDVEVSAQRTAQLVRIAERNGNENIRYVIGTEVPLPGGVMGREEGVCVTKVEDVQQTIESTRQAFYREGLRSAWERVISIVVQAGVEYGHDFVLPYQPDAARELSRFIETQPFVYEAHSTDYQTPQALANMVQDHFAILKVGPALTFAFREGVFALAMMENELFPCHERSNITSVLDEIMVEKPQHWVKYYHGNENDRAYKRKFSLSDRIRYYWAEPVVQRSLGKLLRNLGQKPLPATLLKQYVPDLYPLAKYTGGLTPENILLGKIQATLDDYAQACNPLLRG
jgi:D-tagatose-1,6-bisphosphate aldolase subunit GatZ/KbaZ